MNDAALVWKVAAALYEQQEPLEAMDTPFDALDEGDKTVYWHDANAALGPVRDWLATPPSPQDGAREFIKNAQHGFDCDVNVPRLDLLRGFPTEAVARYCDCGLEVARNALPTRADGT